jgi:hypothetical protein
MIESAFYSVLANCPAITALAGSRIYPLVIPEDSTLPAIDYGIIGGSSTPTFTTPGTSRYRVEINCWGHTYGDAVTLRGAVITNLSGYLDVNMSIQLIQPQDFFDHELLQYRAMAEFYIYFTA